MERMTKEECWQFLRSPARTGKVATVRKNGQPLVVPVWYDLEGETIVFMTGTDALKVKSMRRDPRVGMCVDDEVTPFAYVALEGTVTISADADHGLYWATRIGGRYMGHELAETYGKINSGDWILTVHLTPTSMHGYKDLTAKYAQPAQTQGLAR
jgi:PPOX class probable F420-dependent enzyme